MQVSLPCKLCVVGTEQSYWWNRLSCARILSLLSVGYTHTQHRKCLLHTWWIRQFKLTTLCLSLVIPACLIGGIVEPACCRSPSLWEWVWINTFVLQWCDLALSWLLLLIACSENPDSSSLYWRNSNMNAVITIELSYRQWYWDSICALLLPLLTVSDNESSILWQNCGDCLYILCISQKFVLQSLWFLDHATQTVWGLNESKPQQAYTCSAKVRTDCDINAWH